MAGNGSSPVKQNRITRQTLTDTGGVLDDVNVSWFFGVAESNFPYTGDGNITLSGTAVIVATYIDSMSGGMTLSGSALVDNLSSYIGSGTLVIDGSANLIAEYIYTPSGNVVFGGTADVVSDVGFFAQGDGGIVLSGTTTEIANYIYIPSGSITISGSADIYATYIDAATGTIVITGEANAATGNQYIASGDITLDGLADVVLTILVDSSGTITLDGSSDVLIEYIYFGGGSLIAGGEYTVSNYFATGGGGFNRPVIEDYFDEDTIGTTWDVQNGIWEVSEEKLKSLSDDNSFILSTDDMPILKYKITNKVKFLSNTGIVSIVGRYNDATSFVSFDLNFSNNTIRISSYNGFFNFVGEPENIALSANTDYITELNIDDPIIEGRLFDATGTTLLASTGSTLEVFYIPALNGKVGINFSENIYNYVGTGDIILDGSADTVFNINYIGSGGMLFSGEAVVDSISVGLEADVIAYYKLEDLTDSGPNGYTLTDESSDVTFSAGLINDAAVFTGAVSLAQSLLNADPDFNIALEDYAFSVWFKTSATPGRIIFSKQGGGYRGYYLYMTGGDSHVEFVTYDGTTIFTCADSGAVNDDIWHHVAVNGDRDGDLTIYVDGVLKNTIDISSSVAISLTDPSDIYPFFIGRYRDLSYHFNGLVDEFGMWKRLLTTDEINYLYNGGSGNTLF